MGEGDGTSPLPEDLDLAAVRTALIEWYEREHRSFPWRETTDAYEILVAEVMSQQTQLGRIEDAWEAFLDRWPTPADLANADRSDVLELWSDHRLGYNNRARYLHEAATRIVEDHSGNVPDTPETLMELPGVGPYTANAVASFAFNNGDAVVDTNVKRVLYRAFGVPDDSTAFDTAANRLMPADKSRTWNNAVMELGGVACQQTPRCDEAACPLRQWCHAYRTGDFTAPDVSSQPAFEGSRRQFRGRIVRALGDQGPMALDALGHRVRVDYTPEGDHGREWLRDVLADLIEDGLVERLSTDDGERYRLRQ